MIKQRKIRTRLTLTLMGLTCGVLLAVMLAFNIAVRSYIRSRVSTQLDEVTRTVSEDRQKDGPGQKDDRRFDDRPDRVINAEYSAAVLAEDGSVVNVLHGDQAAAEALAAYVRSQGLSTGTERKVVSLDSGT